MIAAIPSGVVPIAALIGLLCEFILLITLRNVGTLVGNEEGLRSRLDGYARLKMDKEDQKDPKGVEGCLSPSAHEVLLGTIKKVEAKSSALSTVIIFALATFTAVVFGGGCSEPEKCSACDNYGLIAASAAALLVLPLYFSLVGMRHLDLICNRSGSNDACYLEPYEMQKALMEDLLKKEKGYRFSWLVTQWVVILFVLVLVSDAFLSTTGVTA